MSSSRPAACATGEAMVAMLRDVDDIMRDARAEFLESGHAVGVVRREILASWRRSVRSTVRPDGPGFVYEDVEDGSSLVAATIPAVDRLRGLMGTSAFGAILADRDARVLWATAPRPGTRFGTMDARPGLVLREPAVGTNAIGTTLARGRPTLVHGHEHFSGLFTGVVCAAAPILDPVSGRVAGILDVTTAADDAVPLLGRVVERASWNIEGALVGAAPRRERPILERFRTLRRWVTGPMAALTPETLLTNAAAADLLEQSDHEELWAWASGAPSSEGASRIMRRSPSAMRITRRPLTVDGVTGYLLVMDPVTGPAAEPAEDRPAPTRSGPGDGQLTEREREIAHLVAQGQSNKEIASAVWLSPHTVDFHLRRIFQKLAVSSRVELTRVILDARSRDGGSGVGADPGGGETTNSRGAFPATESDTPDE
jgi:transcriptional regulator of acetoin/glycerol metabolism